MTFFKGLFIIFLCLLLGEVTAHFLPIPIPAIIYAMAFLFVGLTSRLVKQREVDPAAHLLLDNMAFFFVPLGVGLVADMGLLQTTWFPVLVIILVSTPLTMIATGKTIEVLQRWQKKEEK